MQSGSHTLSAFVIFLLYYLNKYIQIRYGIKLEDDITLVSILQEIQIKTKNFNFIRPARPDSFSYNFQGLSLI